MDWLKEHSFLIRKIHSLSGIIPLGVFLLEHLITNSFALQGASTYNEKISILTTLPFLMAVEIIFIAIPLAFHTLLGLYFVYLAENNVMEYKYLRNYMFYLQRATAIIVFLFVTYHVYTARIARAMAGVEISYEYMHQVLAQPVYLIIYLIGLIAAMFHFTNGIYTFAVSWGITIGPKSQKIIQTICVSLFIIMSGIGLMEIMAFAV
jgi:succinate dehydrogenase / fumarate reductase cytochrome b subunit